MAGKMIALSAGHSRSSSGEKFPEDFNQTEYKQADLWVDLLLQRLGKDKAYRLPDVGIREKIICLRTRKACGFIEFHFDSSQIRYAPQHDGSVLLATVMRDRIESITPLTGGIDEGVFRGKPDRILLAGKCPSIVISVAPMFELGRIVFFRDKLIDAIAETLNLFFFRKIWEI